MVLESAIGIDEFMSDLNVMDAFINNEVPSKEGGNVWEDPYQELPDSPEMNIFVDQENTKKAVNTCDQFFGSEVCLLDERVEK